jgi:hypothetical protein
MLKKAGLFILLLCLFLNGNGAAVSVKSAELDGILKLTDQKSRDRKLIKYIRTYFEVEPLADLKAAKAEMARELLDHNVANREAIIYFTESIYHDRHLHTDLAINALSKAIELAVKSKEHYLLYAFFSHLAFMQTSAGNTIEAVSNFRMAKKEAILLDDAYLQVLIDINISDIYYKNNFYNQSLFYINQAEGIVNTHPLNEQRLKNIIYINKAENFFRMKQVDSLKKYNELLHKVEDGTYKIYILRNRSAYYLSLLQHDYKTAIKRMVSLQTDTAYLFDNIDRQNLADAYYNAGMPDSAKHIINRLLVEPKLKNHPEIRFHLYEVLGKIAEKQNDPQQAAYNFKMALQQAEDQISRLTQVGNISSQIKIDEMQGSYIQKEEDYKRERLWLILSVIIAVLSCGIIAMIYMNSKQKQYYEKLLFTTKKEELAFINSHEVRRHLSNILGLINLIKHSENKNKEYQQAEEHLFDAAESLDRAIKNISDKLDN